MLVRRSDILEQQYGLTIIEMHKKALDPPYEPLNNTSYFTAHTTDGFDNGADVFRKLADKGCLVLLSNSDTPFIRELYSGYNVKDLYQIQRK
jgi:site-specific DNA-adenine methylase